MVKNGHVSPVLSLQQELDAENLDRLDGKKTTLTDDLDTGAERNTASRNELPA